MACSHYIMTSDSESSSSSYEDDALHGDQRRDGEDDPLHGDQRRDGEDGFQPVQDKPGLYYKVHAKQLFNSGHY